MKRKKNSNSFKKSQGPLDQLKRLLRNKPVSKEQDEDKGGEGSGGTGSGAKGRLAWTDTDIDRGKRKPSYLVDETKSMDRRRREIEQVGHRQLARVNAREHNLDEKSKEAPEGELQNSILQHPWLDGQRFDGIDPNVNPEPPLNTDARREFDNERREQEMEKQLRLGNMPKFSSAPKPGPQ